MTRGISIFNKLGIGSLMLMVSEIFIKQVKIMMDGFKNKIKNVVINGKIQDN